METTTILGICQDTRYEIKSGRSTVEVTAYATDDNKELGGLEVDTADAEGIGLELIRRGAPPAIFSAIEAISVPHDGTLSIHLPTGVVRITVSRHHEEMAIVVPPRLTRAGAQALALLILYSLHTPTTNDSAT